MPLGLWVECWRMLNPLWSCKHFTHVTKYWLELCAHVWCLWGQNKGVTKDQLGALWTRLDLSTFLSVPQMCFWLEPKKHVLIQNPFSYSKDASSVAGTSEIFSSSEMDQVCLLYLWSVSECWECSPSPSSYETANSGLWLEHLSCWCFNLEKQHKLWKHEWASYYCSPSMQDENLYYM